MSTALSIPSAAFGSLAPNSRQLAIIEANLDGEPMREQDLVQVKTPAGGGTTWEIDNLGNIEKTEEIVGVLVGIGKRGYLWPSEEPGEKRPVITTHDMVIGYQTSQDFGEIDPAVLAQYRVGDHKFDWAAMTGDGGAFGWNTGKAGVGKRAKESRILAILRDGETFPLLVSIGGGSLTDFLPFLKKLPAFHYECVIGLRLQKEKSATGITYSQIIPRLVGVLTEEQGEIARRVYTDPLKAMFNAVPFGVVS